MARKPQGHSVAPSGKRVQVILHSGASFVAKFKSKESGYHYFHDHDKVKSNQVSQLRILPTGITPLSYRQELKRKEIADKIRSVYPNAKITFN